MSSHSSGGRSRPRYRVRQARSKALLWATFTVSGSVIPATTEASAAAFAAVRSSVTGSLSVISITCTGPSSQAQASSKISKLGPPYT